MQSSISCIIDTDIGDDIDDTFAIAFALNCQELNIKMILTSQGDTRERAKILAKLLTCAGRTDIEIGVGIATPAKPGQMRPGFQATWSSSFDLGQYPKFYENGISRAVELLKASADECISYIAIAPNTNMAAMLAIDPSMPSHVRLVGMQGSLKANARAEYNVAADVSASSRVFSAKWRDAAIAPLETCSKVVLAGTRFCQLESCPLPLAVVLMLNYSVWLSGFPGSFWAPKFKSSPTDKKPCQTSYLYDCVAIYLAAFPSAEFLSLTEQTIHMQPNGKLEFSNALPEELRYAIAKEWKDLDRFLDLLLCRLISK